MKKLFVLFFITLLLFCGCEKSPEPVTGESSASETEQEEQAAEPTPTKKYEIKHTSHFPKEGFVLYDAPWIFGDKIFFTENQQDGREEGKNGNAFSYNTATQEVKAYDFYTYTPIHFYEGDIYYGTAKEIIKHNEETGKEETLLKFPEDKVCAMTDSYKEYIIYWETNFAGAEDSTVYAYNIKTGETKLLMSTNHSYSPFGMRSYRIKNGFLTYCNTVYSEELGGAPGTSETTYEIRAVSIATGEDTIVHTVKDQPRRVVYNGEYLLWNADDGTFILHNGKEERLFESCRDIDFFKGHFAVVLTENFGAKIYDLISRKEVFYYGAEAGMEFDSISVTENEGLAFALTYSSKYQPALERVYPNWNWDSDGEFFEYPDFLITIDEVYEYPEDGTAIEELMAVPEGVKVTELQTGDRNIYTAIETKLYLVCHSGDWFGIFDKNTGELVHQQEFTGEEYKNGSINRIEKCPDKPEYDLRIVFGDRIRYVSFGGEGRNFAAGEEIMLPEFIAKVGLFGTKAYDLFGEDYVYYTEEGIVLKKAGQEPKTLLEQGYFKNVSDFESKAKSAVEGYTEWGEHKDLPIYFGTPHFVCGGTKVAVTMLSELAEGLCHGFVVYNIEEEKIEDIVLAKRTFSSNLYFVDQNRVLCSELGDIYNFETGEFEKPQMDISNIHGGKYFTGNTIMVTERSHEPAMEHFGFSLTRYDLDDGEVTKLITPTEKGKIQLMARCEAATENHVIFTLFTENTRRTYVLRYR